MTDKEWLKHIKSALKTKVTEVPPSLNREEKRALILRASNKDKRITMNDE